VVRRALLASVDFSNVSFELSDKFWLLCALAGVPGLIAGSIAATVTEESRRNRWTVVAATAIAGPVLVLVCGFGLLLLFSDSN
jgi:threonine/homoserine/homoserine lactone efflux protein